ncbi:MAG: hypothetical protein KKF16_07710 [Euryarchaeota archaeon]|nr:hypothetical protein [Euryarchaeota archaeon]MBV1754180.1 hypothetical protein [Methanobacterium sp.]MBV1768405.1 hypothetical protein [Methanobacterium sp.]
MKGEVSEVKSQVMDTIATLVTTAFGLIAALAWNDAIQALITQWLGETDGLTGLLIYAVVITSLAVVATILIARLIAKPAVQAVRIVE